MPTTYTHDAFGREVYKKLPTDMRDVIRANRKLYLIGLHGPDIFFYYRLNPQNKVVQIGHAMHQRIAREFFERGADVYKKEHSQGLLAYLLGFCCHYMLDSTCHPYVYEAQDKFHLSHSEIETHMDRYYMERDGKDPFTYLPASSICAGTVIAETIQYMFPQVTPDEINRTLHGMQFYTAVTVCKKDGKRDFLSAVLGSTPKARELYGRIIQKSNNPVCDETTAELTKLYDQAVVDTPAILEELYMACTGDGALSERFDRDYVG
ncbi:MAG: zinc dependent phospholipase C family protein [Lachnospiraceae bacterium]|nr:zinc dependent phospholipase C family protein [Lachnospiraceae bacterium]